MSLVAIPFCGVDPKIKAPKPPENKGNNPSCRLKKNPRLWSEKNDSAASVCVLRVTLVCAPAIIRGWNNTYYCMNHLEFKASRSTLLRSKNVYTLTYKNVKGASSSWRRATSEYHNLCRDLKCTCKDVSVLI